MTTKKLTVAVIFGGTNTEHEVSIVSAQSIIKHLSPEKYTIIPIKITKENVWQTTPLIETSNNKSLNSSSVKALTTHTSDLLTLKSISDQPIDIIFPVIHGPYGEDGTLQGMLDMTRIPYVGCGVLGSAVCMDKVIQKQIVHTAGIPIADFTWITRHDWLNNPKACIKKALDKLTLPLFIKPANQGSSIGISKAKDETSLEKAIEQAFTFDHKVIIEQGIANVREIECSVLGNHEPSASVLGEIVPSNEFYDYDAKYIDGQSQAIIPAKLDSQLADKIRQTAIDAFKLLNCRGLARVDFLFNDVDQSYYLNELNTMPGFTHISMYPKLWEASGISYSELLDQLITLGLENHQEKVSLHTSYQPKSNWHEKI